MLEFFKLVYEAIFRESPTTFIASFTVIGALVGGGLGWLVVKDYPVKSNKETSLQEVARPPASVNGTMHSEDVTPSRSKIQSERIFLPSDIDSKYLIGLYKENTSMQADMLAATYLGRWMRLNVVVMNVEFERSSNQYRILSNSYGPHEFWTNLMTFDVSWHDRVSVLRPGSKIAVVGILKKVDRIGIMLDDCEIQL